jgi:hypothetical protein
VLVVAEICIIGEVDRPLVDVDGIGKPPRPSCQPIELDFRKNSRFYGRHKFGQRRDVDADRVTTGGKCFDEGSATTYMVVEY